MQHANISEPPMKNLAPGLPLPLLIIAGPAVITTMLLFKKQAIITTCYCQKKPINIFFAFLHLSTCLAPLSCLVSM